MQISLSFDIFSLQSHHKINGVLRAPNGKKYSDPSTPRYRRKKVYRSETPVPSYEKMKFRQGWAITNGCSAWSWPRDFPILAISPRRWMRRCGDGDAEMEPRPAEHALFAQIRSSRNFLLGARAGAVYHNAPRLAADLRSSG